MHAAWLYDRYHIHPTLRTTPFQDVIGRPYKGKLANFRQIVLGLDPNAGKLSCRKGIYLGKDASGHDVIGTNPRLLALNP